MEVKRLSTQVISRPIRECLTRLDTLIFYTLKGGDSWYRLGPDQYELYIKWGCYNGVVSIYSIKGKLRNEKFKITFVHLCEASVEITLSRGLNATFTSNSKYGYFSVPGDIYFKPGHACYKIPLSNMTNEEFFEEPFAGQNKSRLMTPEVEATCCTFLNDLIDTILGHLDAK